MAYNYAELFDQILSLSGSSEPIANRMSDLIAYCSEQLPHSDWDRFAEIDYTLDIDRLGRWLPAALSSTETEPVGLWFGLNNPETDTGFTADIYVAGSPIFKKGFIDWASDLFYFPTDEYLESKVLNAIYSVAYKPGGIENDAEYPLCLGYGVMVARAALEQLDMSLVPKVTGAAVGFDSGDIVVLGTVRDRNFQVELEAG